MEIYVGLLALYPRTLPPPAVSVINCKARQANLWKWMLQDFFLSQWMINPLILPKCNYKSLLFNKYLIMGHCWGMLSFWNRNCSEEGSAGLGVATPNYREETFVKGSKSGCRCCEHSDLWVWIRWLLGCFLTHSLQTSHCCRSWFILFL